MQTFGNYKEVVVTQHCECTKTTELLTLSKLILCYVTFKSVKEKKRQNPYVKLEDTSHRILLFLFCPCLMARTHPPHPIILKKLADIHSLPDSTRFTQALLTHRAFLARAPVTC
jgi:hypothetical protein